jgi:microcystin degradation protein MlrC
LSKKILIAGLFHETHTFVDAPTSLADFQIRRGDEMLACAGDASPLGGVLEFGRENDWGFISAIDYRATPGGMVADAVLDEWWSEFEAAWPPDCDALYLVLHGAMVCESFPDVEGEILSRIRILPGAEHLPVFGVYDLHANFSPAMAQHADCLVAYRENPHIDARESAVRAASLLARYLRTGERPHIELRQLPIVLPPTGTGTADDPMRALEARARELEGGDIWAINIAAGFAFADTPDTCVCVQAVTTGDGSAALDELAELWMEMKTLGCPTDPLIESVMSKIRESADGLTVLVEPADNIGGGAPGDCTSCLRALVDHQIENAVVCLNDPEAVLTLGEVAIGDRVTLPLGGKGSRFDPGPLELEVELLSRGVGRFELENKKSHLASMCGDFFDMGDCAVVRHGGVQILLTSNKTTPFDLGQWRSQGIDPERLNVIVVKAAVAHRAAYDPIAARSFTVDTPGPCSSNLKRLPFENIQRPIFPLDD